jgi:hypothetical protein
MTDVDALRQLKKEWPKDRGFFSRPENPAEQAVRGKDVPLSRPPV